MTAARPAAASLPLPAGFRIQVDAAVREYAGGVLWGGSPVRVMRLTVAGRAAWRELAAGPVASPAAGVLARRLTDAGLAHPRPPAGTGSPDVTVVIPVRDRPAPLARCLAALGSGHPVLVVDDGSRDPGAVVRVAARYGAAVERRDVSGGPGAARNTGLARVTSEFVAFLDSDCVPPADWIGRLAAHFADPLAGAAAPRITGLSPATWAGRYTAGRGSLDMGAQPARVVPGTRVPYVPTAALVARRSALLAVARGGEVFDPALPVGEDVDLVWRLTGAGWRVRYDPAVRVGHQEPDGWARLLWRRLRYGTSAAPLARRHPGAVPPLVLRPWPALVVAVLLARRPAMAGLAAGGMLLGTAAKLRRAGLPVTQAPRVTLTSVGRTWLGVGRYATQFAPPLLAALIAAPGRPGGGRNWASRLTATSLLLGPPVTAWVTGRPALGVARFVLGHIADDVAYGAGVWAGCFRERTLTPVLPVTWPGPVARPQPVGGGRPVSWRPVSWRRVSWRRVSWRTAGAGTRPTGGGSPPAPPRR